MSECPFGTQAEAISGKVKNVLKDAIDLKIYYITSQDENGNLTSLHGTGELYKDAAEVCVREKFPADYLNFVLSWNAKPSEKPEAIAAFLKLDVNKLDQCINTNEGNEYLKKDLALANQRNAHASPTIFIDGEEFQGHRSSRGLFEKICEKKTADPWWKKTCESVPPELTYIDAQAAAGSCGGAKGQPAGGGADAAANLAKQALASVTDKKAYDVIAVDAPDSLIPVYAMQKQTLAKMLPNLKMEEVKYGTPRANEVIKEYGLRWLPTFLIESSFKDSDVYKLAKSVFIEDKDRYIPSEVFIGSNVNISRAAAPNTLDVYFGTFSATARKVLEEAVKIMDLEDLKAKKTKIALRPCVALNEKGDFQPVGGDPELEEALRLIAIERHFPDKLYLYIKQRGSNYSSSYWQDFVKDAGVDPDKIKELAAGKDAIAELKSNSDSFKDFEVRTDIAFVRNNQELLLVTGPDVFKNDVLNKLP